MSESREVITLDTEGRRIFWCPGCETHHFTTDAWTWNGDKARPTFQPSIRVQWEYGEEKTPHCCHSFVTDGQIQFLGDCTHALAGQTVAMESDDLCRSGGG